MFDDEFIAKILPKRKKFGKFLQIIESFVDIQGTDC